MALLTLQAEDVKCLLSDAMISHANNQTSHATSVKSVSPSSLSPSNSTLSQANASLLSNSPAGSGDGAVNKRSIAEAQGSGEPRHIVPGMYTPNVTAVLLRYCA